MTTNSQPEAALSPTKLALLKIRELKQQLEAARRGPSGDIAIVSMACRFPRRSPSPEAFWDSLMEGRDEVSEIPADRWDLEAYYDENPERPGKMYARKGVFLDHLDLMDPDFFGISPREATWVDPQQRMLLEVSWEALERAAWPADRIGKETGYFVGWMHNDYQNEGSDSLLNLNPYIATGSAGSFLCGRLSYYLGLQGPSLAVDTACSSSLVALHLACQSLHRDECDRALVGGVNAIISPTTNILTCKLKALSPHGHSRAFDAQADGYLRGEGCGVIAIRRLADARRDGDPILAVIRGTAIGHNGFSSGLTAPNPKAQERVIRQALRRAQVDPREVQYLEAHGTGTELGDPIEMQAAAAVLGEQRDPQVPLLVGSVKTNIGHLEAAAGMAGLIKVLLALEHNTIPAQLNFEEPNPHIAWDKLPVQVVVEPTPWPDREKRIAGVSAFGMSGTNAHVVIESVASPGVTRAETSVPALVTARREHQLVVLSGKTEDALHELAGRYRRWLAQHPQADVADVAFTLGCGRRHFDHRAASVVHSAEQARALLEQLERGGSGPELLQGHARTSPKVAWQFTGQGSQYVGMAKGLYDSQPVFRDALNRCDELLQQWREPSLLDVLFSDQDRIHHTSWTQPGLFAIQMGMTQLLNSWGLEPDVVLGHSVGQYAAACTAGMLSWEDGLRLISERGRLIGDLPSGGSMVAVFASPTAIQQALASENGVGLAALNGSHSVISGPAAAVDVVSKRFAEQGIRCRKLTTSHAFHSTLMEPALEPFARVANEVEFQAATVPLICNISGQPLPARQILDGDYWSRHIREPVRYADAIDSVRELGCQVVLELGPQPVLTGMAAATWPADASTLISCLRKDQSDEQALLSAMGKLYVRGVVPDFTAMHQRRPDRPCRRIVLPTYPFQRQRYWGPAKPQAYQAATHTSHPLLGGKRPLAGLPNETRFESWIAADQPGWMSDHQVMDDVVCPGAAYVEAALAASAGSLQEVAFEQPLRLATRSCLQTIVRTDEQQQKTIEMYSLPEGGSHWTRHFSAVVATEPASAPTPVDPEALRQQCPRMVEVADFYQMMHGIGLDYGPQFQTIQSLHVGEGEVLARLQTRGDMRGYAVPPTVLDGAFHSLAVQLMSDDDADLFLPVGMDRVECLATIDEAVWCHGKFHQAEGEVRTADLVLFDDQGQVVLRIEKLKMRRLDRAALRKMAGAGPQRLLYEFHWRPSRLPATNSQPSQWLVVKDTASAEHSGLAESVVAELNERGQQAVAVQLVDSLDANSFGDAKCIVADQVEPWAQLLDQWHEQHEQEAPDGVVWVMADASETAQASLPSEVTRRHVSGLLNLVHVINERGIRRLPRGLQLVTDRGVAMRTDAGHDAAAESAFAEQSQYWGLGRVIGAEQPELGCRLIDVQLVERPADSRVATSLVDVLMNDTRENQIAIRDGQLLVPRLNSVKLPAPPPAGDPGFSVHSDASYLITGGLGMLGRQAAMWLARHGAEHVVLVSRRAPDEAMQEWISSIRELGCQVHVHSADLSSQGDVDALMARFEEELPPLRGVIHAAGVLDDALLSEQSWARFETVLAPKVRGAWMLHESTSSMPLDFFILYSSAASVLGSPGQSNYATANGFLDGLAWFRRSIGLPALSVNWGPWTEGMADDELIVKRLALQGITPLTVTESHQALERMVSAQVVQATVLDVDWRRMRMGLSAESPPLLDELAPKGKQSRGATSALVEKLRTLQGPARQQLLRQTIQNELQAVLSTSEAPDTETPLIEMGLDSLMAVEFSTRLQQQLGDDFALAPTLLFDYPTISAITDYLLEQLTELPAAESAGETAVVERVETTRDEIAIVGMSCRFPGASGIQQYWENLQNGVDAVREIPADRWDVDQYYSPTPTPGKMYTREGGFLDNIGDFDAGFFNISQQEACWIDPQHRLLLEVSWEALEDAGISTQPLADPRVGVFMGIMSQDYAQLQRVDDIDAIDAFQGAGLAHSAGVGRISYLFGFEGPSIAVDTASSSSLVAVCQATKSLLDGDCNLALAGGVNAILTPGNSLLLSKAKMLSPDGRCKSFSAAADGFGRGEGCGVVVLKRRRDAERDGDQILAVIRGAAVSHNGFSGGLTTPSGRSQERVIREALDDAGVAACDIQYLEAHGTGTELGDPIELRAAANVLGKGRPADRPLLVGSAKPNIGHLEAAGGVSGLIKTVLAMHHGTIPRQLHFDEPSPHIPWNRIPVRMVSEPTAWPEGDRQLACVNALGMSGTNAHVVLTSAPLSEDDDRPAAGHASLLVLSGRQASTLPRLAAQYDEFLAACPDVDLGDVCHTLSVGRRHFEHRAAVVVESAEQARRALRSLAAGQELPELHVGVARKATRQAWWFGDAGAEIPGLGTELYRDEPVFREVIDECDAALGSAETAEAEPVGPVAARFLPAHENADDDGNRAALEVREFALQMGLASLWQSWGLEPDIVGGIGVGQYSAACLAGVLRIDDATRLVAARQQLTRPESETDDALDVFEALADTVDYFPADRPLVCSLTGQVVPVHRLLGGSYWRRHCVEPAQLPTTLQTIDEFGCHVVLELGTMQELANAELWPDAPPLCLPSVVGGQAESATMLKTLARLYAGGITPDFGALHRPWRRRKVSLPTYPFQRSRYWLTDLAQHANS